ncbi:hypothetical protein CSKR_113364 [Clonorchis sinensis]|uniref:Uncharacterized protein n=1 Tax=Clonorchis sinensis TaxID=79923 RepID=A0A3R7C8P7_CLOSI|nr:hypothetical protein CSKR_113364 [Clonorchis sinensis]
MACLIRVVGPVHRENPPKDANGGQDSDTHLTSMELSMEEAVQQILDEESIATDTWSTSRNGQFFKVEFSVIGEDKIESILDRLAFFNVGKTVDSSIMVIEPTAFLRKRERPPKTGHVSQVGIQEFLRSLKSRLCVAQVYNEIKQRGRFDMNYLCNLICAAVVADIALVTNSAGVVFASMLLSPLMDPIMCILFGLTLREPHMLKTGARNTAISLLFCVLLGLSFGYIAHSVSNFERITPYPTGEMKMRGQADSFIASMLVASFSGISVAFATLSKRVAALIGNAISLSLLPPAVNSGQLLLLSLLALTQKPEVDVIWTTNSTDIFHDSVLRQCRYPWIRNYKFIYVKDECHAAREFALLSACSFLLVTMNILLILVTGYSVNKLKDMAPRSFTDETVRRFYQKDLPEVIGNYDCLHKLDAGDLATRAYKEYLRVNQINPDQLSAEESKQIASDYCAVMQGVGRDQHLRTITAESGQEASQFLQSFIQRSEILAEGQVARIHGYQFGRLISERNGSLTGGLPTGVYNNHHTIACNDFLFNNLSLGEIRGLHAFSATETLVNKPAALRRLRQLERLGERDDENAESVEMRHNPSSGLSVCSSQDQAQQQQVGKFHVVPTQLSMDRMEAACEGEQIDRV